MTTCKSEYTERYTNKQIYREIYKTETDGQIDRYTEKFHKETDR
jgi:hypothetical protein